MDLLAGGFDDPLGLDSTVLLIMLDLLGASCPDSDLADETDSTLLLGAGPLISTSQVTFLASLG